MKERPILFSAPMVLALRGNRKTQTRRTRGLGKFNTSPECWRVEPVGTAWVFTSLLGGVEHPIRCPYGVSGDKLWTRECFARSTEDEITYRATINEADYPKDFRWRPSIHMPRWASRETLEVVSVKPERLQNITEEDARAEGAMFHDGRPIGHHGWRHDYHDVFATARDSFHFLWESIHGPGSWDKNSWVWAITFRRLTPC